MVGESARLELGIPHLLLMVALFIALVFGIVCGSLSSSVAESKGCSSGPWFWAGLFLGPIGLIAACGMPDRRLRHYLREIALAVGAKEESLGDERRIELVGAGPPPSLVDAEEGDVFQIAGSSPEAIWESLLELLPAELRDCADLEKSEYYRVRINIRDANKRMIARFYARRVISQGKFWKLAEVFPRP
jgi:hypothetical protein